MTAGTPDWLRQARGVIPTQRWSFATDAPLSEFCLAREAGIVMAADESGGLYVLDRRGRIICLTRTSHAIPLLAISATGTAATAAFDGRSLAWLSPQLQIQWTRDLPDEAVGLAMDAHGTHVLVSLASGQNLLYNADKKKVGTFESLRPLRFSQFLVQQPAIVSAADYGFLARFRLDGEADWSERLWSGVADLAVTADGGTVHAAGLSHGIKVFNDDGSTRGSFVMEGTTHLVDCTYVRKRLAAATLERQLLLLDAEGNLRWQAEVPDDLKRIALSPLGDWLICGFADGRLLRLDCP